MIHETFDVAMDQMIATARVTKLLYGADDKAIDALKVAYWKALSWMPDDQFEYASMFSLSSASNRFPQVNEVVDISPIWGSVLNLAETVIELFIQEVIYGPTEYDIKTGHTPTLQNISDDMRPFLDLIGGPRAILALQSNDWERSNAKKTLVNHFRFMLVSGNGDYLLMWAVKLFGDGTIKAKVTK